MPGATLAQVQSVLRDYAEYKNFYRPKVIESQQLAHSGDEYDVLLRLYEKHILTVVLNSTYHIRYEMPDPKHLIVTSRSTHIGEVKDPGKSYTRRSGAGRRFRFSVASEFLLALRGRGRRSLCALRSHLAFARRSARAGMDAQGIPGKLSEGIHGEHAARHPGRRFRITVKYRRGIPSTLGETQH